MDRGTQNIRHDVTITSQSKMHLTAIDNVSSFDENGIYLEMNDEEICVEGEGLHIEAFDADTKELSLTGHITGLFYSERGPKKGKRSLFRKG